MQRTMYQLSGRIGALYSIVIPIALFLAGAGGYLHGFATVHNPVFGLGSLVLALLLGFGVGWAVSAAGFWGRCRNRLVSFTMGAFIATLALYVSWATAMLISFNGMRTVPPAAVVTLLQQPEHWFLMMWEVAQSGWPSHFHHRPQGPFLWVFWLLEWGLVAAVAGLRAVGCRRVYCESCGVWLAEPRRFHMADVRDDALDVTALEEARWSYLTRLQPTINMALQTHVLLTLFRCHRCREHGAFGLHLGLASQQADKGVEIDFRPMTPLVTIRKEDLGPLSLIEQQNQSDQEGGVHEPLSWLGDKGLTADTLHPGGWGKGT